MQHPPFVGSSGINREIRLSGYHRIGSNSIAVTSDEASAALFYGSSHSTVTLLARFLGWSTSHPRKTPM
jgi:hypothetical protein